MSGARAMAWKEMREITMAEGKPAVQMAVFGLFDLAVGILVPVALARTVFPEAGLWPTLGLLCAAVIGFAAFMGFLGPLPTVADAFAGERERHTLETLLASPIRDGAILWGKMAAQYAIVGAHVLLVSLAAGITSAILLGPPGLLVLLAGVTGGALAAAVTASFVVGLGVLLSLRAPTVKKAQERLSWVMMPIFFLPAFGPGLLLRGPLGDPGLGVVVAGLVLPFVLLGGAVTFNVLVFARFRRDRLIGLG